jgi:ubiquinone/menaquinone biosynthesis C-methylase UbiE
VNELSTRERYQRIAPLYDLLDLPFEYRRYRALRPLLFEGLAGTILDAGVGTGRNFPFYPIGTSVIGIDVSPAMLACARQRLSDARAPVELREMDVTHLDFPDGHFDNAVATFLFCVLRDEQQIPALTQIKRVLKPGGIFRLLEYTRPTDPFRRAITNCGSPGCIGPTGRVSTEIRNGISRGPDCS